MKTIMGSTRALACPDRRLAGQNGDAIQLPTGDTFMRARVFGEGADHST
jgi:hypothetical protein